MVPCAVDEGLIKGRGIADREKLKLRGTAGAAALDADGLIRLAGEMLSDGKSDAGFFRG